MPGRQLDIGGPRRSVIDNRTADYRGVVRQALREAMAGTASLDRVKSRAESVLAASFGVYAIARIRNHARFAPWSTLFDVRSRLGRDLT